MDAQTLIDRIVAALRAEPSVRGLCLAGSRGRGTSDDYSDVDLVAIADADAHEALILLWVQCLESIAPVVYWNQRGSPPVLLNAITEDWLRCDLVLAAPDGLQGRSQDGLRPLIDRDDALARLPVALPVRTADPDRIRRLIDEFLRVLGLLHVVVGRHEWVNAVSGAGLLRDLLTELLIDARASGDRGGALHLSRLLPPEDLDALAALPYPRPERAEVIRAHFETARLFLTRARLIASSQGVPWPVRFEDATLRLLAARVNDVPGVEWLRIRRAPS